MGGPQGTGLDYRVEDQISHKIKRTRLHAKPSCYMTISCHHAVWHSNVVPASMTWLSPTSTTSTRSTESTHTPRASRKSLLSDSYILWSHAKSPRNGSNMGTWIPNQSLLTNSHIFPCVDVGNCPLRLSLAVTPCCFFTSTLWLWAT